jgi:MarR family transcriptional regulator, lower aerobic nicotinate degradation pathway regulator
MDADTDTAAPARLTGAPTWQLNLAAGFASRLVTEGLSSVGARGYHYRVLATLSEYGAMSQVALGRRSSIYVSDMVATLNELAEDALVERSSDPEDRRRNVITITQAGERRLRWLDRQIEQIQEELLVPLNADERAELMRLLGRLVDYHRQHRPAVTPA